MRHLLQPSERQKRLQHGMGSQNDLPEAWPPGFSPRSSFLSDRAEQAVHIRGYAVEDLRVAVLPDFPRSELEARNVAGTAWMAKDHQSVKLAADWGGWAGDQIHGSIVNQKAIERPCIFTTVRLQVISNRPEQLFKLDRILWNMILHCCPQYHSTK